MTAPKNPRSRRFFLQWLAGGLTLTAPGWALANNGLWMPRGPSLANQTLPPQGSPLVDDLPLTPTQTAGPFYPETPIDQQLFGDTDLLQKLPGHEFAKGQSVNVKGNVKNRQGKPIAGAIVEVWQACASGRYNHSADERNPSLLDNNFQFWGRAIAGENGDYEFLTIIPGKYPGRTGRHIHFRIVNPQKKELVTQCYFSEYAEDNARDGIYRQLDEKERKLVTLEIDKPSDSKQPWSGDFQIVMQ